MAYVEDTSEREITKRDPFGYEGGRYVNPQPRIILEIADCSNRIKLEFDIDSELDVENSLHKVDILTAALAEYRTGLVEEARLYRDREPEVERLNRSVPQPRRRRRLRSARVARSMVMDASRLAAFPGFADLPAAQLDELAGAMSEAEVEAGATVITIDDYGTAVYFIEAGDVDVLNDSGDAIEALGPGDTFGEIGLLLTGQRTASVVARTPLRLLSLAGQDFDRIRPRVPEVERSLRILGLERVGSLEADR